VLCALREGRHGVAGLTSDVERLLLQRGVPTRTRWYEKRPILVTANDPSTRLYNGDVGVIMAGPDGRPLAWFEDAAGGVRAVAPARLPAHETAWAMTVHKSQGSEFDHVVLVLPEEPSAVVTRELLYTAVTRARRCVSIVGSRETVAAAVERTTARASGLAGRLSE
jgi:exodeoxyribonuclease V alpha subunit